MKIDINFTNDSVDIGGIILSSSLNMKLTFQEDSRPSPTTLNCKLASYRHKEGYDSYEEEFEYISKCLEILKDKKYLQQVIKDEVLSYLNHRDRKIEKLKYKLSEAFIQIKEEGFEFSISD